MRLFYGSPGCPVIFALPAALILMAVNVLLTVLLGHQVNLFITGENFGFGAVAGFGVVVALFGFVIFIVGRMTYKFMLAMRTKTWLSGPHLIERRYRVDLRSARLSLDPEGNGLTLTATDPRSGRTLNIMVEHRGFALPAPELTALADAILATPTDLSRSPDDQTTALMVTSRLRDLASFS